MNRKSDTHFFTTMHSGQWHRRLSASARWAVSCLVIASGTSLVASASVFAATPDKPVVKADIAKGQALAGQVCAACHAADGNSVISANPILAGQHAGYLSKQLHNFKVKPGASQAERVNAVMAGFAATLSEDDIRNISAFYAAQRISPAVPSDKDLIARGQQIYRAGIPAKGVPACAGCHSPNGAGIPAQYPRLSGQHADYTASTLTAFRSKERGNSGQMMAIAAGLSDGDIRAVAEYVAGLR
jgi:cbb3-type cytochrome c oxidase subunit III